MEPELPAISPNDPKKPILIKASLKYHTPQEIYDYVCRHVGQLGMKIKKRHAVIGFENEEFYEKLLSEHKIVMLHGKKLEFYAIPKSDQNYIVSEDEEEIVDMPKNGKGFVYPDFKCINTIEAKINSCRVSMMDKVQAMFVPTIEETRQRVQQLRLQFPEPAPRKREMYSLECALEKKFKALETKYEQDVGRIHNFIRDFSAKPINIDLEPTFTFEQVWQFPKIELKNLKFQRANYFTNKDYLACKRLFPINGSEFVVTMATGDYNKSKAFVKFYDVKNSDPKEVIPVNPGAYGLCRANNFLLFGTFNSTIKYINMDDPDRSVQSSQTFCEGHKTFFDIKVCKSSVDRPQILALGTDNIIRRFEITTLEVVPGLVTANFEEKMQIPNEDCVTFEVINSSVILMGASKRVKKYQMEKKIAKEINVSERPVKIKKFSPNLFAVAESRMIQLVDLRTEAVVQTFHHIPSQLRSIEVIGQHSLMYGCKGEIGLLDDRKHEVFPWKSEAHHKGIVYDILKLKETVVSCDSEGFINCWKLADEAFPMGTNLEHKSSVEVQFGKN